MNIRDYLETIFDKIKEVLGFDDVQAAGVCQVVEGVASGAEIKEEAEQDRKFQRALDLLSVVEGGYANHPSDRGGETVFGVARKCHPQWSGWAIVDRMAKDFGRGTKEFVRVVDGLSDLYAKACELFRLKYWTPCRCDELPEPVAILLFDSAINHGVRPACKIFQRAVNRMQVCGDLAVDGYVGPLTLEAFSEAWKRSSFNLLAIMLDERRIKYEAIVQYNPGQKVFLNGWMNRIAFLRREVLDPAKIHNVEKE